jgi:hypothetical protein
MEPATGMKSVSMPSSKKTNCKKDSINSNHDGMIYRNVLQ